MKTPGRLALLGLVAFASPVLAQVTIPPHASVYNGFTRGFNFTANTTFLINQLDLPPEAMQAGDTASYMVLINGVEVLRSVGNAGAISTSIVVSPGDVVDILGNWSPAVTSNFSAHNSYGSGARSTRPSSAYRTCSTATAGSGTSATRPTCRARTSRPAPARSAACSCT
jgi:hypothetical protein